jgi:hypothetical protein
MRILNAIFATIWMVGLTGPVHADVAREVGQSELRRSVASGESLSLKRVIEIVGRAAPGEAVDVRLYEMNGLFYRVIVVQPDGQLLSVVMNARTGDLVPGNSETAEQVRAAAKSGHSRLADTRASTNAKADPVGNSVADGSGGGNNAGGMSSTSDGNSPGNSGGNSGGNGVGNGQGSGNGNGNGNGNGAGMGGGNGNRGGNGNK